MLNLIFLTKKALFAFSHLLWKYKCFNLTNFKLKLCWKIQNLKKADGSTEDVLFFSVVGVSADAAGIQRRCCNRWVSTSSQQTLWSPAKPPDLWTGTLTGRPRSPGSRADCAELSHLPRCNHWGVFSSSQTYKRVEVEKCVPVWGFGESRRRWSWWRCPASSTHTASSPTRRGTQSSMFPGLDTFSATQAEM